MEIHSKNFTSKRDYHEERRRLVSSGHVIAHSNGKMTRFQKCFIPVMEPGYGIDDTTTKWVLVKEYSGCYKLMIASEYDVVYNDDISNKIEFSSDGKTITLHMPYDIRK